MNLTTRYTLMLILSAVTGGLSSFLPPELIPRGMILGVFLTLGLIILNHISAARYARGEPPHLGAAMLCGAVSGAVAGFVIILSYGVGGLETGDQVFPQKWFNPVATMVAATSAGFLFHTAYVQRFARKNRWARSCFTLLGMILAGYLQSAIRFTTAGIFYPPNPPDVWVSFILGPWFTGVFFAILWYLTVTALDPADGMVKQGQAAKAPAAPVPEKS